MPELYWVKAGPGTHYAPACMEVCIVSIEHAPQANASLFELTTWANFMNCVMVCTRLYFILWYTQFGTFIITTKLSIIFSLH